jgi:hypothetical protein
VAFATLSIGVPGGGPASAREPPKNHSIPSTPA